MELLGKVEQGKGLGNSHSGGFQAWSLSHVQQWHVCAWECSRGAGFLFG